MSHVTRHFLQSAVISATNTFRRCSNRTAMDTVWNIGFAIAVVITWFRARWVNEGKDEESDM
jgi:hypothetical protein